MSEIINENIDEIKIILLGNCGVGKTNIITRYVNNEFREDEIATLSSYYVTKKLVINNKKISANIWDTAGQEKYMSVTKMLIQETDILILCYSIVDEVSFKNLDIWLNSVIEVIGEDFTLGILGNKSDLIENETISEEEGENYANEHNALFKLVSAKVDKVGIDKFFHSLIERYINDNERINKKIKKTNTQKISSNSVKGKHKKKCCK